MKALRWLNRLRSRPSCRGHRRAPRLNLEYLEDRCVPAALTIATATIATPEGSVSAALSLAPALVHRPFTQSFTVLGGSGADSFRLSAPLGLDGLGSSWSGNVLTLNGTPAAAGSFAFTLGVSDSAGNTATASYVLNVAASPIALVPSTVTPAARVNHYVDVPVVTGSGGSGHYSEYRLVLANGTAPDGLSFHLAQSESGFTVDLTGYPTGPGAFPSFLEIEDEYGNVAVQPFTLLVSNDAPDATPLTLFSALNKGHDLPLATVNRPYTQLFGAFGGTGNLTFHEPASVDGLTFSTAHTESGVTRVELTGRPRASGSFVVDLAVTDPHAHTVAYYYTLTVEPEALRIGPAFLHPATRDSRYLQDVALLADIHNDSGPIPFQLSATGGARVGYVFTATGLPAGMALTSTGVLCGTPAVAGSYTICAMVTDAGGHTASRAYTLTVLPSPTRYYTPAQIAHAYGFDQIRFNGVAGTGQGVTVVILESDDDPRFVSSFDPAYRTSDMALFDKQFGLPDFGNQPGVPVFLKLDASGTASPGPAAGTVSSSGVEVTGAGTKFTDLEAGQYIGSATLGYFKIAGITDNTHLTLATAPSNPFVKANYYVAGATAGEFAQDVEWVHALAPLANIVVLEGTSIRPAVNWDPRQLAPSVTQHLAPGVLAQVAPVWVVSDSVASEESVSNNNGRFVPTGSNNVVFVASASDRGARGTKSGVLWPAISPDALATGETELVTDFAGNYIGESGVQNTGAGVSVIQDQPAYQRAVVDAFSTEHRTSPDVSFVGSGNSGVAVYNSWPPGRTDPWGQGNGTSLSAPAWAALIAIADQGRAMLHEPPLSSLATSPFSVQTLLYQLFQSRPGDFHNVTEMNDGTANPPGYNLYTGLGSPVADRLVQDLIGSSQSIPTPNPKVPTPLWPRRLIYLPATGLAPALSLFPNENPAHGFPYAVSAFTERFPFLLPTHSSVEVGPAEMRPTTVTSAASASPADGAPDITLDSGRWDEVASFLP